MIPPLPVGINRMSRQAYYGLYPIGKRFRGYMDASLCGVTHALTAALGAASRRACRARISARVAPVSTISVDINDVTVRDLTVHGDARGRVFEGWREEWTPFTIKQLTEARAQAGVMKGLHLHYIQWDWWRVVSGRMLVGLYDARPHSSTFKNVATFEMSADEPRALAIPPGVAHGFYALEDLEMIYLLSELYNVDDEHGVKWDSVGIDWPLTGDPIVSDRDINLPDADALDFAPPAGAPAGVAS